MAGNKETVTIVGDTSSFHLGSKTNYEAFRLLVRQSCEVLQEIPYNAFGVDFISFDAFLSNLKRSRWWSTLIKSDRFIVHGEGLTEKHADYVYPYLYFSRIAKLLGKESWLVNFSMYEGELFSNLLSDFSYLACRDVLTQQHLQRLGFDSELSFDCCVLSVPFQPYTKSNGKISAIAGRNAPPIFGSDCSYEVIPYNACWEWKRADAVSLPSFIHYADTIRHTVGVLSSSFHGNVLAYLSGVPFLSLDRSNKKYEALEVELLPDGLGIDLRDIKHWEEKRESVYGHFSRLHASLVERAKRNVKCYKG